MSVPLVAVDERSAKAAIYGLNSVGGRTSELEEVWLVQALVREDGLTQVEAAELLHKRFAEFGPNALRFLEGLLAGQRYGKAQAFKVLALLGTYTRIDWLAALERAVRFGAYSLNAVERILAAQVQPRSVLDIEADYERQPLPHT